MEEEAAEVNGTIEGPRSEVSAFPPSPSERMEGQAARSCVGISVSPQSNRLRCVRPKRKSSNLGPRKEMPGEEAKEEEEDDDERSDDSTSDLGVDVVKGVYKGDESMDATEAARCCRSRVDRRQPAVNAVNGSIRK